MGTPVFNVDQLKELLSSQGAVSSQEFETYAQEAKERNVEILQYL